MDINFRRLGRNSSFEVLSIHLNGNHLYVGNQISWFGLPTKTLKIGTPRTIVLSQYCNVILQGTLEFTQPDPKFHVQKNTGSKGGNSTLVDYDIFGHGGMIFWLASSLCLFVVRSVYGHKIYMYVFSMKINCCFFF